MKKALTFLLLFLILVFGVVVALYFIGISMPSKNQEDAVVVIKSGDGVDNVATQLKEKKVIISTLLFKAYLLINNKASSIQPGEFSFKQVNLRQVVSKITQPPEAKKEVTVTVLEGWNSREMSNYLQQQGLIFKDDFESLVAETDSRTFLPEKRYEFLMDKPLNASLEGYLFPDTYRFFVDTEAKEVIEKMLDNFDQKLTQELRQAIKDKNMTLFSVITLASIVEKEAQTQKDKKIVAGIFLNRLEIGQRLESDATVNFVTGKKTTRPKADDLAVDSLYNTYIYSGLPIGPICSPGLNSIEAVVNPEKTDYLYFLNTPSGNVVYSKTYEEHLANKNKYYSD